ncbi:MAG: ThuA domain-containing protein, partial [Bacteroidota bacterium]
MLTTIACDRLGTEKRLLIFSKTAGYRHQSIETGIEAIQQLAESKGYQVEATEEASIFNERELARFSAVIFLNTTGDVLDAYQQADFERYIQAGGGFVGIHAATDTEHFWPWYGKLVGAYFNNHPETQPARLKVLNKNHPSTKPLPAIWERTDEWYNFKNLSPDVQVLVTVDESSYTGGTHGDSHPMVWCHNYDGGRAFYTALGHTEESFSEPLFLEHLAGGIAYAVGDNKRDYAAAKTKRVPAEDRFVRTVLWQNFNEPMELDVFEDGKVMVVERKGNLFLWDPKRKIADKIATIPVYSDQEDGLMGIAIDPNYPENNWIYLCYSPAGEIPKQHISRFVFDGEQIDLTSEKVVLEVPVQRDECCHSGGSLEFGPKGNLFITIGDDTNPFESDGYAPIDERPGRSAWDAQKSSANANDLRGKILRIKPEADGSYSIPEGNLFPVGTPNTRPEIYVMGCRNPFRHSIDQQTGYLYWGDIGPDAGKNRELRGPKGIDEFNQAKGPGNWGWPYTRGNNQAYYDYNFATQESNGTFRPDRPVNNSPNNTGPQELPPTQSSMIWYSYDQSEEFPWVEVGGKNPMAGPIYYADQYAGKNKFPDYFDGKILIYEWMRNWIYALKV